MRRLGLWLALAASLFSSAAFAQSANRSQMRYAAAGFSATITFATPGDLTVSYVDQQGYYVLLGNQLFVSVRVSFTPTYTTASGSFSIVTGVPYNCTTPTSTVGFVGYNPSTFTYPAGTSTLAATTSNTGSAIVLRAIGSATAPVTLSVTNLPTGTAQDLRISMNCYVS